MKHARTGYSLDDILLIPQRNPINSRLDTNLYTKLTTRKPLAIPIMATNMSTITESDMVKALDTVGAAAAIHRFNTPEEQLEILAQVGDINGPKIASVGVGLDELDRARYLYPVVDVLLLDVAHAHSDQAIEQVIALQKIRPNYNIGVDIMVGNIATYEAAKDYLSIGVDGLRVGIGGGSRCLTRTVTGHGVPNLTALIDVVRARNEHNTKNKVYVPIILDGGIRNSGDIVKALYFGADVVSLGNMLAGTKETPGEIIKNGDGVFKKYYGMASKEAQDTHRGGMKDGTAAEGFSELVPYKGSVVPIIQDIIGGIRSGLTYSGARNIPSLRRKGDMVILTPGAQHESKL